MALEMDYLKLNLEDCRLVDWLALHITAMTAAGGYSPHTARISWESDVAVSRVPSLGLKTVAITISTPAKECREARLGPRHGAEPGDSWGILCQVTHSRLQLKQTVFPSATSHSMALPTYSSVTPT